MRRCTATGLFEEARGTPMAMAQRGRRRHAGKGRSVPAYVRLVDLRNAPNLALG
jgi:hypothetical protein